MRLLQLDDLMTSYTNARPKLVSSCVTEVFAVAIEMPRADNAPLGECAAGLLVIDISGAARQASSGLGQPDDQQGGLPTIHPMAW